MDKKEKIFVAGANGMVGSAIVRKLKTLGYSRIYTPTENDVDLTSQEQTIQFFQKIKPDYVFLAAAKVGGIMANSTFPADFMYINTMIEMNTINAAWKNGCKRLQFIGSSCIYPRLAKQPMKEEDLLSSELEKTNEAYALAKITGLKYCEYLNRQYGTSFFSVLPTNLYGINDNFHPQSSHVLPSLMRKMHEAKINNVSPVTVWGTGKVFRELMFVDDMADASVYLMNTYKSNQTINIGTGLDMTIADLAAKIKEVVGYKGEIFYDTSKPDGPPRKLLDISKLSSHGWVYKTPIDKGIRLTYDFFLKNHGCVNPAL